MPAGSGSVRRSSEVESVVPGTSFRTVPAGPDNASVDSTAGSASGTPPASSMRVSEVLAVQSAHRCTEARIRGRSPMPREPTRKALRCLDSVFRLPAYRAVTCPRCHSKTPSPNPRCRREGPEETVLQSPNKALPRLWKGHQSPCRVLSACRHQLQSSRRTWRECLGLPREGTKTLAELIQVFLWITWNPIWGDGSCMPST